MNDTDRKFFNEIYESIKSLAQKIFPATQQVDQSTSLNNVYEQVFMWGMDQDSWMWLLDLYVDETNGGLSAIFSIEGKIFQASVTVTETGISMGALVQVVTEFKPVGGAPENTPANAEGSLMGYSKFIVKQATETEPVRWFLISSSTVLNRNGAMNSKNLFDKFAEQDLSGNGEHPAVFLDFFHMGEVTKMGMVDWVGRDDNLLLASGTFNDSIWAECMQSAWADDPDYWGSSISFWPLDGETFEIAAGIQVPGYTDGYLDSITTLPEKDAACLLTALQVKGKVKMQKEMEDALKKLSGGDSAVFDKLKEMADGANSTIVKEGLIHLSAEVAPVPAAETVPATAEVAPVPAPAAREITLDDELVELMVEKVTGHPKFTEAIASVTQSNTALSEQIAALSKSFGDFQATAIAQKKTLEDRMAKVEKPIEEHVQQVLDDRPAVSGQKVVIHRPREVQATTQSKPRASEIAEETLAKFGN
jgi:hypothetical protein